MKLLILLSLVFAAGVINAYETELSGILQLTQKVNQYVTECIDEYGENEFENRNYVLRAIFSEEDKDNSMENITHCFFRKTGILNHDGNLNVDTASSILASIGIDKKQAEEILEKCTSITGYDADDTAYAVFKCFEEVFKA